VHQDQVLALPEGARLLASSETCAIASYAVGDRVLGVQPHPELNSAFVRALLASWREALSADVYDASVATLDRPQDGAVIGRMIVDFIARTRA
jgi:GMP synthase-like glutamine amidotransferase